MIKNVHNNDNILNINDFELKQYLPYFLTRDIPTKTVLCISILKKDTGILLKKIKQLNYNLNQVNLKDCNQVYNYKPYLNASINNQISEYNIYDCSFLKRARNDPNNKDNNLVLIDFIEDLEYKNITINKIKEEFNILDDKLLIKIDLPYIQPISAKQIEQCKQLWSINILSNSNEKYIYTHNEIEETQIKQILINLYLDIKYDTYLYDPKYNKIICKGKEDINKLIEHGIMNMLNNYSLILSSNSKGYHLGIKDIHPPIDNTIDIYDSNLSDQYYCENMYVFTKKEPCIMCSMALIHNRISRIYFWDKNKYDGGLVSKVPINNYNLNHHYLIYQITPIED